MECPGCGGRLELIPRSSYFPDRFFCRMCRRQYPAGFWVVSRRVTLDDFLEVKSPGG